MDPFKVILGRRWRCSCHCKTNMRFFIYLAPFSHNTTVIDRQTTRRAIDALQNSYSASKLSVQLVTFIEFTSTAVNCNDPEYIRFRPNSQNNKARDFWQTCSIIFLERMIDIWNRLDDVTVTSGTPITFKRNLERRMAVTRDGDGLSTLTS